MLKPVNYQDLFDRVYPLHHLSGLSDESQISVGGLNDRLGTIRNNERSMMLALNAIVAKSAPGDFLREFLMPFCEVAAHKRFQYDAIQKEAARYKSGHDASGDPVNFTETQCVFYMNDVGGMLISELYLPLVFRDGLLLKRELYTLRSVQGGVVLYIKYNEVPPNSRIDVVILRKFNQFGITHSARFTATASAAQSNFSFVMQNTGTYGNAYDLRYLKLFRRRAGENYYSPMPDGTWAARYADTVDTVVFSVDTVAANDFFQVVPMTEFWERRINTTIPLDSPLRTRIPLVMPDGSNPAPVLTARDVDVYHFGRLMRPEIDYKVIAGDSLSPQGIKLEFIAGDTTVYDIVIIANAPYNGEYELEWRQEALADIKGIAEIPKAGRKMRLLRKIGMAFSGGYFDTASDGIETIGDNKALHISALSSRRSIYYRFRSVLTTPAKDMIDSLGSYQSPVEHFIDVAGLALKEPPETGFIPYIQNYKATENPADIPDVLRPAWPTGFSTSLTKAYYWVQSIPAIIQSTGRHYDVTCRPEGMEGLDQYLADDGRVDLDCRGNFVDDSRIVNVNYNCRDSEKTSS